MKALNQVAAVIALCAATAAQATTFGAHIGSQHFPAKDGDNNANSGLYVRFDNGVTLGGYRNTIRRNSVYLGYSIDAGAFGVTVGGITGYQQKDGKGHSRGAVSPLLALSVVSPVSIAGLTPRLAYVPGHLVKAADVVHLMVERSF